LVLGIRIHEPHVPGKVDWGHAVKKPIPIIRTDTGMNEIKYKVGLTMGIGREGEAEVF